MTLTTSVETGPQSTATTTAWRTAVTRTMSVDGTPFAYRELGPLTGVPLVFLHHFTTGTRGSSTASPPSDT